MPSKYVEHIYYICFTLKGRILPKNAPCVRDRELSCGPGKIVILAPDLECRIFILFLVIIFVTNLVLSYGFYAFSLLTHM